MKWTIVAFNHPWENRSVLYRQDISTDEGLVLAIRAAILAGANLMSIRGFKGNEG